MSGVNSIMLCPSVPPINIGHVCNTAVIDVQVVPTSGFYAGVGGSVSDVCATVSGQCLTLKTSPTVARSASQISPKVRSIYSQIFSLVEQSTLRPAMSFPRRGLCRQLKHAGGFFYFDQSEQVLLIGAGWPLYV